MKRVYLLLGPEEGEKDSFIDGYISRLKKEIGEPPEIYRFYPFESNLIDVLSLLRNGSLFAKHKIVILNQTEEIKKKEDLTLLIQYLDNPVSDGTLFLLSTEVRAVKPRIQRAVPPGNRKIFWEMFENKKTDWVKAYFRKNEIRIDHEGTLYLLEMIENNTKDLRQECERLSQFLGKGTHINIKTIEKYCYHSREETVFTLFERIASRDFVTSHEVLYTIMCTKESEPTTLLSGILWQLRRLSNMKQLVHDNYSLDEVFTKLRISNKKGKKIYNTAHQNYSMEEVQKLIQLVAEFELRLRSVPSEVQITILQLFLYYAIVRGGNYPRFSTYQL